MQSLALAGLPQDDQPAYFYGRSQASSGALGDRSCLPLGAIWGRPNRNAGTSTSFDNAHREQKRRDRSGPPTYSPGLPILALFPGKEPVTVLLTAPSFAALFAGTLMIAGFLFHAMWGWDLVSASGVGPGLVAGLCVGLGQRSRPVTGLGCITLSVLGTALLGGRRSSVHLAVALALSTFWQHGWWLHRHPATASLVLVASRSVAVDAALGFLVSTMFQLQVTKPPKVPAAQEATPSRSAQGPTAPPRVAVDARPDLGWTSVTPPSLRGRGIRFNEHGS